MSSINTSSSTEPLASVAPKPSPASRTQAVLAHARASARKLMSPTTNPEHLLLGLLNDGQVRDFLKELGVHYDTAYREVRRRRTFWAWVASIFRRISTRANIPDSPKTTEVLRLAEHDAAELGQNMEPEHLLRRVLAQDDTLVQPARPQQRVQPEEIQKAIYWRFLQPDQGTHLVLKSLRVRCYRSLREPPHIHFDGITLFIGANASGKSTVLDALRFLNEAIRGSDFEGPVNRRGGFVQLAWKGEYALNQEIELQVELTDDARVFRWRVRLSKPTRGRISVREDVWEVLPNSEPRHLLETSGGEGWWLSRYKGQIPLQLHDGASCGLAIAAGNKDFPARHANECVRGWKFLDPNPFLLRRGHEQDLDLAQTFGDLTDDKLRRIANATKGILGVPNSIETREQDSGHRFFVQWEPNHNYPVNQQGISSGTARILALMTVLNDGSAPTLIGIEEPENYVHPEALRDFLHYIGTLEQVQFLLTTHSPLVLNYLNRPEAVRVVKLVDGKTTVAESRSEETKRAMDASGLVLGEYYETMGFGR